MKWAILGLFTILATAALSPAATPSSGGASPPLRPGEVTVVMLGDVMLGRGVGQAIKANGPAWPFAEVRDLLRADLVFANLESPLAAMPPEASPALNLAAGAEAAETLVAAGIDVVSLANNHALDAGPAGLVRTLDELARHNVVAVGAGRTTQEARQPVILRANGVRVAFLAFADVPQATGQQLTAEPTVAALDPDVVGVAVARARREADLVVVSFHWGEEYSANPTARQRDLARRAVAAGAHLVVGGHPHAVQPVELLEGAVVAYSLGNFVFDQRHTLQTTRGQALKVRASRSGIEHVEISPVSLASGRPIPAGPAATAPNANVAFALGRAGLLAGPARLFFEKPQPEADLYPKYQEQMAKAQEKIKALSPDTWTQNLYWSWLYTFQPLLQEKGEGYPTFMRSKAWVRKDLHTNLGSWAELKHDTILYAKQSYAERGDEVQKPPHGYVEPNPEVFARLAALTRMTREGLAQRALLDRASEPRLVELEEVLLRLKAIAEKELAGEDLSEADDAYVEAFGATLEGFTMAAADPEDPGAPTGRSYIESLDAAVVADVATGAGQVLEVGVGRVLPIYVVVPVGGRLQLNKGGVFSYYEFTQPLSNRLTDEEWRTKLEGGAAPARPTWTESFIAH